MTPILFQKNPEEKLGSLAPSEHLGELQHGRQGSLDLGINLAHLEARLRTLSCLLFVPTVDQLDDFLRDILVCGL